ncbi:hypothetical protein [Escherichia phage vB_EcoP_PAS7]|uniref:Internal virion protein n=1 Tax=Escherichia phage vB_EcoP_PAS7 TaxID=3053875 RepID=A0AA51Z2S7_9CAUD|nr:hypothetical protein [Escherichia phage vB_EcoP_PAS7]
MWQYVAAQAAASLFQIGGQIEAQVEQSKAVQAQLAKGISQLNLQRSQSRRQTSAALFNVQQGKQQALSQVGLQAAASDTVGASVRDAVATVNVQTDRQDTAVRAQQLAQEQGFFQQAEVLIQNARANTPQQSGQDIVFNAALSIAGKAAGSAAADGVLGDSDILGSLGEFGQSLSGTYQSWKSYLGGE